MTSYVAGFLMSDNYVYLVRKKKPEHLAGKLNAIGGKINDEEAPYTAMVREFEEEVGAKIVRWSLFCKLVGCYPLNGEEDVPFEVYFYWSTVDNFRITPPRYNDVGELIGWYHIDTILQRPKEVNLMPNCLWLIPMVQSFALGERAHVFEVTERY